MLISLYPSNAAKVKDYLFYFIGINKKVPFLLEMHVFGEWGCKLE